MADDRKDRPLDLGIYGRLGAGGMSATDIVATILTVLWLLAVLVFFFVLDDGTAAPRGALGFLTTFVAIFLPVAMIWIASSVAKTARVMREESARLQSALDAMRQAYVMQQQTAGLTVKPSTVEKKLDEIARAQRKTETAIATFATRREAGPASAEKAALPRPAPEAAGGTAQQQARLALGTAPEDGRAPITVAEFIRALNFPETEADREGFAALRRALQDHALSRLVRAAQDVLTLLSQDGIYMDDLAPDRAAADVWRRFAAGERGAAVATLGGIHDRSSIALAAGRMKKDPVFRDAVHHFLRQFDKTFAAFETAATDAEIAALSDTRTARAFMLLGRVTGTFD